jgi:fructokinase
VTSKFDFDPVVPYVSGVPPAARASSPMAGLPEPARRRVLLFGEALVDVLDGDPVPGGAPLNVAVHLASLGFSVVLVSRIGDDPDGELVRAVLKRAGISESGLQVDRDRPTARSLVSLDGGVPRFTIPEEQAFDFLEPGRAGAAARSFRPGAFCFGTLVQRSKRGRAALDAVLGSGNALRVVDLNLRPPWFQADTVAETVARAHVLKVSEEEAFETVRLLGLPPVSGIADAAAQLSRWRGPRQVFVTRGGAGAIAFTSRKHREELLETPASPLPGPLRDTVGAGDAFTAAVLAGAALDWPARETLRLGSDLAAAVCGLTGPLPPDASFWRPFRATFAGGEG